jgi:predicted RNase H-like nuclease (RuvC/YqgF family)
VQGLEERVRSLEATNRSLVNELEESRRPRKQPVNFDSERADMLEREVNRLKGENGRLRAAEEEAMRLAEKVPRLEGECQRLRMELEAAERAKRKFGVDLDQETIQSLERELRKVKESVRV